MNLVIDSKRYEKLIREIGGMFRFEDASDQYDSGKRDGWNEAIEEVQSALSRFWKDVTN